MKVIAGLGNPGKEYENTKHNVGFRVIDKIAEDNNINVNKLKFKAFIGEGTINGEKVMLVKPQTFMNLSGESIKQILAFYKVPAKDFFVIYDDTSLPLNAIRIRQKGSAGGHNGIKNIIQHLGSDVFDRIKVGIGEKPSGWDLADYVLSKFSKDDEPLIRQGIDKAAKAAEMMLKVGTEKAMNEMNRIER
ncbi:MAG: aminoacyl-tRNA hydrolase [Firmicutes bacterium]|nr:aminoacyl-tRNA hydrolase [Bacillota bacterium]